MGFAAFRQMGRFLLFSCLIPAFHSFAASPPEKITLSLTNVPLETAFREIEQQTDYRFVYTNEELEGSKPVSLNVKNSAIEGVLKILFEGQPVAYSLEDKFIIIHRRSAAAPTAMINVSGTVLNETGDPVAGVTVSVKGTDRATSSDADGLFAFQGIDDHAVLVFTGVNVEAHELQVNGQQQMRVSLKTKVSSLGDVAVILNNGYQNIPKERATGSFVQINNGLYNQQVGTNVTDRLEPIVNGLSVDRKTNKPGIMIRGLSTIKGPKAPLIVLDNFPYEGDINNINPNDIESVTVLKDAAAASIWGTKAGNGVIILTTKKGRFNKPLSIDINSNVTVAGKPDLFYLKQMSSNDFINVETYLFNQGFYDPNLTDPNMPAISPVVELLSQARSGLINTEEASSLIDSYREKDVRNDFNQYLYGHAVNQQYSMSLQGGSSISAWRIGAGLDKDLNELTAKYNRVNLHLENTIRPIRNFQVITSLYFTESKSANGKPGYFDISSISGAIPPYTQLEDANGQPLPVMNNYRQTWVDTVGGGKLLDWSYYPLDDYKHTDIINRVVDITADIGLNYKIINGLYADMKYRYERQQSSYHALQNQDSYFSRNLVNFFTQINGDQVINVIPKGAVLDISDDALIAQDLRGQLNFDRSWKKHKLVVLAGTEIRESHNTGNSYRTYGYDPDLTTSGNVDYTNVYPSYLTGTLAFIPNYSGFGDITNRFVSYYANLAYSYLDKYTFSLSGRRDASNLFGVETNDKWTPLWSTGLAWNLSRERFFKISFLPYVKIRATYGTSGNVDQTKSALTTMSYQFNSPYTRSPYAIFLSYANPDLRWEKVKMANLGIDFSFKRIISGNIEYYHKRGVDLFGLSAVDYTGGVGSTIVKNAASMTAHGIDLELTSRNIDRGIKWTTTLILDYYSDKITSYYLPPQPASFFVGTTQPNISGVIGKPVYSLFSYPWAGLDPQTGDPLGKLDKQPSKDYLSLTGPATLQTDLTYNGAILPSYFGSLGNHLSWRNLNLEVRITYKLDYYFRRSSINYSSLVYGRGGHSDFALRWQKPGDEVVTNVPSFVYPIDAARDGFYNGSSTTVERGDFVRLQYITVAYDVRLKQFPKMPLHTLRFYVNANNLGIIWKRNKEGIDPDFPDGSLPPLKTISLGLRANF